MTWDVLGNEWAVEHLQRQIQKQTTQHAYLISGPNGVGKAALANEFARALQCENAFETGQPCGECRACKLILSRTHPDIHFVTPEEESTGIAIDQIRKLQPQLALSPFEGRWRIAILPDFHNASAQATNAILKTSEEPPPRVKLILTTDSTELVLPTLVSRCEVLQLRSMAIPALSSALIAREVPEGEAARLAAYSAGLPVRAVAWLESPELLEARFSLIAELQDLLSQGRVERFTYVQGLTRKKAEPLEVVRAKCRAVLDAWLGYFRDLLMLTNGVDGWIVNEDRRAKLETLAASLTVKQVYRSLVAIHQTQQALSMNANPQLAMEALILQLPRLKMA